MPLALPLRKDGHGCQAHAIDRLRAAFDSGRGEEDVAHDLIAIKGHQGEQARTAFPQLVDYVGLSRLAEGLFVQRLDRALVLSPLLTNHDHVFTRAQYTPYLLPSCPLKAGSGGVWQTDSRAPAPAA